jgi:hypothetical protein
MRNGLVTLVTRVSLIALFLLAGMVSARGDGLSETAQDGATSIAQAGPWSETPAGPAEVSPSPTAEGATRESTQALMSAVSQDVWHARRSSEHNAQMLQAYKAGEDAYFSGDYEKASKKLKEADAMTKNSPNDYGGGGE